jgi:hypothetical protein
MGVLIKYHVNEYGVVSHPTEIWNYTKDRRLFSINIGSKDGFMWAVGTRGYLSLQGWGSPVSMFNFISRDQAIAYGVHWMYKELKKLENSELPTKDLVLVKEALKSLHSNYDIKVPFVLNDNIILIALIL